MKHSIVIIITLMFAFGCGNQIKNNEAEVIIEAGTEIAPTESDNSAETEIEELIEAPKTEVDMIETFTSDLLDTSPRVFWVGDFRPHSLVEMEGKHVAADEGLWWGRNNKISISIDKVVGDSIVGHSVVAGNDRPFYGRIDTIENIPWYIANEPGDDKYDGQFRFRVDGEYLIGEWDAYKKIDIPKRMYTLTRQTYKYNPETKLQKDRYGNWNKFTNEQDVTEVFDEGTPDEEIYEWVQKEFASTTPKVWEINASSTELTKKDVENLTSSDLLVIRNAIFARHGYSFKNRPLRVFFDRQKWYIPVHTDVRKELTALEKMNIQLLLRYEKNAKEYYDFFGRG